MDNNTSIGKESTLLEDNKIKTFETLYNAHYVYLCTVATKFVYNPEIAKEIVNDAFLSIWDKIPTINTSFISYLRKTVQNRCLNYLRDQHIQLVSISEAEMELFSIREQQLMADEHPLARLENKELEEIIKTEIAKLPPQCRKIFDMSLYQGKSYDEIAKELEISPSTVRGQIKIGIGKLREQLGSIHPILILFLSILLKKNNIS